LISLVSWIASTCLPATAPLVGSPQPAINRSTVTCRLAMKRLNCTSRLRSPSAARRKQLLPPRTIRSSSTAPLGRGGDPQTDPIPSNTLLHRARPRQNHITQLGGSPLIGSEST